MAKVVAICNQKGGVGKTTTSVNIACSLALLKKRILLVDLDPQGSATTSVGINRGNLRYTIYELFLKKCKFSQAVYPIKNFNNFDIIPATVDLGAAEINLIDQEEREYILEDILSKVQDRYDYIFLDCPPTLGLITLNALYAANSIIIPVQCQFLAIDGLTQLFNTIRIIQKHKRVNNKQLDIEGILLTMLDKRTKSGWEVVNEVKTYFKDKVFKNFIVSNVAAQEAPAHGIPLVLYKPKSPSAKLYKSLAKEFLKKNEK